MAEPNNISEAEDTKTRVTAKISPETPGEKVPQIDLNSAPAADAKNPSNTMTGRTMKLQGLAGMAPARPAVETAVPAAAAAPAAASDTRTKRTVKLASLAAGPTVKNLDLSKKQPAPASAPAPAPAPAPAASTVTRRTQKLEALDTQDVVAMTAAAPSAVEDTKTRKATKISAVAAQPSPQSININNQPRQTVKVTGIAPGNAPAAAASAAAAAPATVQISGVAPATQSPVRPVDNAPETIQISGVAPATQSPVRPVDEAPGTIQIAAPAVAEDTKTRAAKKVEPAPGQFKAGNVDDTVKLQRPAPKPVMPGSVAPAVQGNAPAAGGIKLNKPKPAAPKPVAKPAEPAAEEKPAEKNEEVKAEESKQAEPTGNLGKDQTPPKKRKGLKVNTDAIKDLGSSPAAAAAGAPAMVPGGGGNVAGVGGAMPVKQVKESVGLNVTFAIFGVMALLVLVFVALVATFDYLNIWQNKSTERIDLPIISEHVYGKINQQ